jgi:hypothetical protein
MAAKKVGDIPPARFSFSARLLKIRALTAQKHRNPRI